MSDLDQRSNLVNDQSPTESKTTDQTTIQNVIIPSVNPKIKWDLEIANGKMVSLQASSSSSCASLLLPPLCHPHVHLDKPYILRSHHDDSDSLPMGHYPDYSDLAPTSGSFQEALAITSEAKTRYTDEDLQLRGLQLVADSYKRHGVASMRAFVEVDHVVQFKAIEAAKQVKKAFAHLVEVQLCLFAQDPIFSTAHGNENRELLLKALDTYRDDIGALGTTPYVEQGADKGQKQAAEHRNIDWAVETAIERGLHLDFHLDYNLDDTSTSSVTKVVSRLREREWLGNNPGKTVVIGHCTHLSTRGDLLQEVASQINSSPKLPVHFVGLPTSDMFMMGRPEEQRSASGTQYMPHTRPRGTLQIPSMIKDFGLNGCLGVNNVGNAFTPYGDGDPLQLASWGTGIYQAGTAADAKLLYECVSVRARQAIGLASSEPPGGVPLPGLLVRNCESTVIPGPPGKEEEEAFWMPSRQRLSIKDVSTSLLFYPLMVVI